MIGINAGYSIETEISPYGTLELMEIEAAARTCYRSEDNILEQGESAKMLVKKLIEHGHEAMLEHSKLTVRFTCDRAIANEIVRHRIASFAQESTRYCNYSRNKFNNQITCIMPIYMRHDSWEFKTWWESCCKAEKSYMELIDLGMTPGQARGVLPLSLATKLLVTANYREWRNILKLRTQNSAHIQMRELMIPLLKELKERIPIVFDDIEAGDLNA